MFPFADYTRHDGLGLASLVRRREISPTELLEEVSQTMARNFERMQAARAAG